VKNIYEEIFKIYTWDVDSADRLTISSAFNYCQEAAGIHANQLGVGIDYMKARGMAWILSRMSLELVDRPSWGNKIRLRTWPRGSQKLYAIRDYELLTEEGLLVGRGRAAWLIIDTASMRPKRPEAMAEALPLNPELDALPDGAQAIAQEAGLVKVFSRTAAYSDIDYNKHVNNARYAKWAEDAMPEGLLSSAASIRMDINYLAEVLLEEKLEIFVGKKQENANFDIAYSLEGRNSVQKPSFRAEIHIKQ